jgi:hypothetical protein
VWIVFQVAVPIPAPNQAGPVYNWRDDVTVPGKLKRCTTSQGKSEEVYCVTWEDIMGALAPMGVAVMASERLFLSRLPPIAATNVRVGMRVPQCVYPPLEVWVYVPQFLPAGWTI